MRTENRMRISDFIEQYGSSLSQDEVRCAIHPLIYSGVLNPFRIGRRYSFDEEDSALINKVLDNISAGVKRSKAWGLAIIDSHGYGSEEEKILSEYMEDSRNQKKMARLGLLVSGRPSYEKLRMSPHLSPLFANSIMMYLGALSEISTDAQERYKAVITSYPELDLSYAIFKGMPYAEGVEGYVLPLMLTLPFEGDFEAYKDDILSRLEERWRQEIEPVLAESRIPKYMRELIDSLDRTDYGSIIELSYGFSDGKKHSLKEIRQTLELGEEKNIQAVKRRMLRKWRADEKLQKFYEHFEEMRRGQKIRLDAEEGTASLDVMYLQGLLSESRERLRCMDVRMRLGSHPIAILGLNQGIEKAILGELSISRPDVEQYTLEHLLGLTEPHVLKILGLEGLLGLREVLGTYDLTLSPPHIPTDPIGELGLPFGIFSNLRRGGIDMVYDVLTHSEEELLDIRLFNRKSFKQLDEKLREKYRFGYEELREILGIAE